MIPFGTKADVKALKKQSVLQDFILTIAETADIPLILLKRFAISTRADYD